MPIIIFYKLRKKNKINHILIIEKKFYSKKEKITQNSLLIDSIKEFVDGSNMNLNVIPFYADDEIYGEKFNIKFIKSFFLNMPRYVIFRSDYQDPNTVSISLFLMILLKLFEKKVIFISHSGDPNWINNEIRSQVCKKIFDAHSYLPQIFIKKTNKIMPMPEFGITMKRSFKPSLNRAGDIFYIGRLPANDERYKVLSFLIQNKLPINIFGYNSNNFLSQEEFYKVYRNYKITINFPKQVKSARITNQYAFRGRVLDAISHGVLLFDQKNCFMDILFKPDVHYVSYKDKYELLEKLKYYLKNYNTKGFKIAKQGYDLIDKEYRSLKVWSRIFSEI